MGLSMFLVRTPNHFAESEAWCDGYQTVEQDSTQHPTHTFSIGYFRSSYNRMGTNTFLLDRVGKDMWWVFGQDQVTSKVQPDWAQAKARAELLWDELNQWLLEFGNLGVIEVPFSKHKDLPQDAVRAFGNYAENRKQQGSRSSGCYSNGLGFFCDNPGGLEVVAVMPGVTPTLQALLGGSPVDVPMVQPAVYVVFRFPEGDGVPWYLQALDIIRETCDWVLAQPEEEQPHYGLFCSG